MWALREDCRQSPARDVMARAPLIAAPRRSSVVVRAAVVVSTVVSAMVSQPAADRGCKRCIMSLGYATVGRSSIKAAPPKMYFAAGTGVYDHDVRFGLRSCFGLGACVYWTWAGGNDTRWGRGSGCQLMCPKELYRIAHRETWVRSRTSTKLCQRV